MPRLRINAHFCHKPGALLAAALGASTAFAVSMPASAHGFILTRKANSHIAIVPRSSLMRSRLLVSNAISTSVKSHIIRLGGPFKANSVWDSADSTIESADASLPEYSLNLGLGKTTLDSGNFPDLTAFDFNADSIYPGSVVQGAEKYIQAGQLVPVGITQAGGTVTLSDVQFNSGSVVSKHVSETNPAKIQQAIQDLTTQKFSGDEAGAAGCTEQTVYSSSQASYAANASFGYLGMASIKDVFSSADDHTQNHILMTCYQDYFTAGYVPDARGGSTTDSAFFASWPNAFQLAGKMGYKNPPLFVESVTYGSELFVMFDSSASVSDMSNTVSAAVNYAGYSGSASFNDTQKSVLKSMTVHALAIGGRASAQAGILTRLDTASDLGKGLVAYLRNSLNISSSGGQSQEVGLPISYKLSYLNFHPVQEIATINGTPYQVAPAALKSASVHFHQEGDGKDWDTEVDLSLLDGSGARAAYLHLGKNTPFGDNSDTGEYALPVQSPAVTKALLTNGKFEMAIHPNGHDTWNYTAYVTLRFTDGTTMTGQKRDSINQDSTDRTYSLSSFVH